MRSIAWLGLCLVAFTAPAAADTVTIDAFDNTVSAAVSFNDGAMHSGTALLTQYDATYNGADTPVTFNTFCVDLCTTVTAGQSYAVTLHDLAATFPNAGRIAYIYQQFGQLDADAIHAAAAQLAIWDLSLANHDPTGFAIGSGGLYSSGDPDVFSVDLGANPDAGQIATLTNQYLQAAIGATGGGSWLDSNGNGPSVLAPVPEPAPLGLGLLALAGLLAGSRRRLTPSG